MTAESAFERLNRACLEAFGETLTHVSPDGVQTSFRSIFDAAELLDSGERFRTVWYEKPDLPAVANGDSILRGDDRYKVIDVDRDAIDGVTLKVQKIDGGV